jgi:hypothetical protein
LTLCNVTRHRKGLALIACFIIEMHGRNEAQADKCVHKEKEGKEEEKYK